MGARERRVIAMRKIVLSLAVIAISAAYVIQAAAGDDGGIDGLVDRLLFRWSHEPPPLDLDNPVVRDDLYTSISAPAAPAPVAIIAP